MFGAFCGPGFAFSTSHGAGGGPGGQGGGPRGPGGPDFGAWFWGGPGRRRGGRMGGGRFFEQGDLKFVILRLLDEKPRHGYEVIKALEERSGGMYSPSPGTVYPTLTLLEDMGYARSTADEGGRKIYAITDEGRAHLAENHSAVEDVFERIGDLFGNANWRSGMGDLAGSFKDLGRAAFGGAARHRNDPERVTRIREVIERAVREIDELAK